jgi:sarcosine oxidase
MGSAAAYHLARQGAHVIGLEQFETGHVYGSSHGQSRVFRTTYDDLLYVQMARESLEMWRELEQATGCHVLDLTGLLVFASQENARFTRTLRTLAEVGLPHEVWDGPQVARRFPTFEFSQRTVAFHASENGVLRTDVALQQLRRAAVRHGAEIRPGCRVMQLKPRGNRVRIETQEGVIEAAHAIVTAGPWLGKLLSGLNLPLEVTREQKAYFHVREPYRFHPERFPVFCEYDTANYGFPSLDGDTIKVAADHQGAAVDPDDVDRTVSADYSRQMTLWLQRWQPGVVRQAAGAAVCLYTNTPDRDFVIDRHPCHRQVVIGGGFSGHGMKFAILVGKWLADLAVGETDPRPTTRFRIDRFGQDVLPVS